MFGKCNHSSREKSSLVHKGLPSAQKYQTTTAGNPKRMNGKGKGVISSQEPTEMSANKLLNVKHASNPKRMNGKGYFGKVNPKAPDRTPASNYVHKGLVK